MTLVMLGGYLLLMLLIGAVSAARAPQPDSFYVASRRGSAGLVASSLLATIIGASATLGLAANASRDGLVAAWWLLAGVAGLALLAGVFAPRIQAAGVYTLPALLARQYGDPVRRVAGAVIAVAWLGVIAAQLVGIGAVLRAVAGGSGVAWTLGAAVVVVAYTALGGQLAVLRTDAWQLGLMLVGLGTAAALALGQVGGFAGLASRVPADLLRFPCNAAMPPLKVLGWLVVVGLPYAVGPDMVSRLLCARDGTTARRAAALAALALVPIALLLALLGVLARALDPAVEPREALLTVLGVALPGWAAGWLAAALLAALMSSASTCLLTTATILAIDLGSAPPGVAVRRTRWLIGLVGALATVVALGLDNLIAALLWAYSIYTGGLVVPVIAGFWADRLRLSPAGALAAMVAGGGVALAGASLHREWGLAALLVSALVLAAVSRLTCRSPRAAAPRLREPQ